MNSTIFILTIISLLVLFIVLHLQPLSKSEVYSLGSKWRKKRIVKYFIFNTNEFVANLDFKKRMNPNGSFYDIDELLYNFPSVSSSLLKYKKHEWIIIGFEKNKRVQTIWVNKGFDRENVSLHLDVDQIARRGINNGIKSILIFHNHPNTNPNQFNCSNPSRQDLISAREFAKVLNNNGLNLIEFVCERGRHHEYFRSVSHKFYPINKIVEEINIINGTSKFQNFKLHMQRLF